MAENVVVTINVRDLGSDKVRQFAKNTRTALNQTASSVKTTNSVFGNFSSTLAKNTLNAFAVLPAYAAVGAAIGGLTATVGAAIKDIVDFDRALRNAASISPELRANFEGIRKEIIKLPPALGTTTQIAEGLYETLSTGISVGMSAAESLKFTADAALLSKAALIDNATSVKALASTLQAYGAAADRASQFADIFQKTVNLGAFTGEELAAVLGRVTPIASQLGISFSETGAAIATLSNTGLSAAESVTALRQILNQAIQNVDEFAAAGIDVQKVLSGPNGIVNFFNQLREATGGNDIVLKRFIKSVRGWNGAAALQGKFLGLLTSSTTDFANATGEATVAMDTNQKSISAGFDRLRASFDRAVQRFSDSSLAESISTSLGNLGLFIEDAADGIIGFGQAVQFGTKETTDFLGITDALAKSFKTVDYIPVIGVLHSIAMGYGEAFEASKKLITGVGDLTQEYQFSAQELEKHGDALRSGGLAAAEAFEMIMKARNANLDAARELSKVELENIGVLESLSATMDTISGRFDDQGKAITNATASLKGMGFELLDSVSKQDQMRDSLIEIIKGTNTFASDLDNAAGSLAKNLELTGDAADNVKDLATRFGTAIRNIDLWREELRAAGATAEELSGKTDFTAASLLRMSEASGLTISEVSALVTQFKLATIDAEGLGNQLKVNGADIDAFKEKVVGLQAEMVRSEQPTLKFAAALQVVAGTTLSKLNEEVGKTTIAIRALAEDGTVNTRFLIEETEKLIEKYRSLGLEVPKDLQALQAELHKTRNETLSLADAFEIINGTRLDKAKQELETFGAAIRKLGGDVTLSGTALFDAVEDLAAKARAIYGEQIPEAIRRTIDQQAALARSTTTVGQAFESLNGITFDSLNRSVAQAIRELDILFVNGKIGSVQMKEEIARLREQVNLLGPAGETAFNPMLDALERSIPLAQTLNDALKELGAKTITQLKQEAQLAGDAFIKAFQSGTVSGKELVRVFESEVAPAFEAAGLRIPNSLILAFEKARGRSEVEAARLGNQIGEVLGNAIGDSTEKTAVNRVGQVISTIEARIGGALESISDRFDRIAPGTKGPIETVRFGSSIEDLRQNEQQLQNLLRNTTGATAAAASSREQLNKALAEVRRRIKEIEDAEAAAKRESESFSSTTTSGLNNVSRSVDTVASSYDRLSDSVDRTTDSIESATRASSRFSIVDRPPTDTSGGSTSGGSLTTGISGGQTGGIAGGISPFTSGGSNVGTMLPFGRFQTGIDFARQGQLARLDRGEMVVPRDIAKRLRSLDIRQTFSTGGGAIAGAILSGANFSSGPRHFVPGTGFVGSIIIGRRPPGSSLANGGFSTIPGFGTVPNQQISNAVGNSDQLNGENSQINMQRKIIPLVRGAITRRDLTRDISGATALTNKGQPSTGGS